MYRLPYNIAAQMEVDEMGATCSMHKKVRNAFNRNR